MNTLVNITNEIQRKLIHLAFIQLNATLVWIEKVQKAMDRKREEDGEGAREKDKEQR